LALPLAVLLGACDLSTPEPPRATGPAVHVVGMTPADGFGVDCEPGTADCGVALNATLSFRFDRFLNPATATRQAIRVYTGDPKTSPGIPFDVTYDPVERVVQYRMPSGYAFHPNTLYQLELVVPSGSEELGIRAFDGAPLEAGELPLEGSFFTGIAAGEVPVDTSPTCADIVNEVFKTSPADCSSSRCHSSVDAEQGAPHGLWLDSRANFRVTAINRVARQTEVGDRSGGLPLEQPSRFGVQMPLIQPGNPGNSYLLYKLLRAPDAFEPCEFDGASAASSFCREAADTCQSAHPDVPFGPGTCIAPSADELERLREWFVRGEPMPIPRPVVRRVGLQQLRAISSFITAGADCTE
jgi:hypothetical protein